MILHEKTRALGVLLSASIVFSACGQQGGGTSSMNAASSQQEGESISVPVSFQSDPSLALALAAPSLGLVEGQASTDKTPLNVFYGLELTAAVSYSMSLTGCKSALTGTVTTSAVKVFVGDSSCLVKLSSFNYNGNTYNPKSGAGFTTWLANDLATFVNSGNANDTFVVKVNNQLTQAGVVSGDTVSYGFYQLNTGAAQAVGPTLLSQAQSVSVSGDEAPNFIFSTNGSPVATGSVAPVVFNGVNSSGAGQFVFNLYCSSAMGATGKCGLSSSDTGAVPLTSIAYKLIADTYSVNSGTALTVAQLQTIMASGTSTINTSTDVLSDNNKGFKTSTLVGPGAINSYPNMILVLSNGTSYTYFSIQIQTVSNN